MDKVVLDITEFADRFGICRASVYNMINRDEVRTVKLGRRRVIPTTEVQRLLDERAAPPKG